MKREGKWLQALLLGARFYHGKLCKKHPEAEGKRYLPSCRCVMCAREHSLRQGKARVAARRQGKAKVSAKQEVEQ